MSNGEVHVHKFETDLIDEAAGASGNRLPYEELLRQREILVRQPFIATSDKAVNPIIFFNQNRQMLHANPAAIRQIIRQELEGSIGLRLGELFGCDHKMCSRENLPYQCHNCNSMPSLLTALSGRQAEESKHLVLHPEDKPERVVYKISAVPISAEDMALAMMIFEKKQDSDIA